jgi:leucine dehydrogenase
MSVFAARDFAGHEQVVFAHDPATGLKAIIAIHNTARGPALGGCRMWSYASEDDAVTDALRLSRGMTYKAAVADLALGGGKSVIIGDSRQHKTPALMQAMGRAVERLAGRYIIAEDVGTNTADMTEIRKHTRNVVGLATESGGSGDPSPATAWGCFLGLKQAVKHHLKTDDLRGVRVAVQGLGNVGQHLCHLLHEAGAKLIVADIRAEFVQKMVEQCHAVAVTPESIIAAEADVFAPCALGAIINDRSLDQLKVKVVAGSANNQLEQAKHGDALMSKGILYCPDYVINAGGLINVSYEQLSGPGGYVREKAYSHIERIAPTLQMIFEVSQQQGIATSTAADRLAEQRLSPGNASKSAAA